MLLLSTAYLPPVAYFAHLYHSRTALIDHAEHYVKQTYRNRAYIATPAGPQALTLPVERDGAARRPIRDLQLSSHGNWPHLHRQALVTAYESSAFFDYYADDLLPLYDKPFPHLVDFNTAFTEAILRALDLDVRLIPAVEYLSPSEAAARGICDLRAAISPKAAPEADAAFTAHPYYQVFQARTGFLKNLSIVDLLFNMGPETRLVLRDAIK